jgi:lysine/ornithine N-monooxygenase
VAVHYALKVIAESHDFICADRLQPNLVKMAQNLSHHGELEVIPELMTLLDTISVSTVKRILRRLRQDEPPLPRREAVSWEILGQVAVQRVAWPNPGHFEVDLVHDGGQASGGHYVHSLQMIDVATGWSERAATWGRSYRVMRDAFVRILARRPFPVREIHSVNGTEFLQHRMIRFW